MDPALTRRRSPAAWHAGCGVLILLQALTAHASAAISREYEIKAAFLFNFTRFIEWPGESFANATSPIVIGVIGSDPFGPELAGILQGRLVNGRAIVARTVTSPEEARTTHLLFVGLTRTEDIARLMQTLAGSRVLTVGESPGFAALGGTITFVLQGDKVRFEINPEAAERAHVRISAQLEKLATVVHRTALAGEGTCCATSPSAAN